MSLLYQVNISTCPISGQFDVFWWKNEELLLLGACVLGYPISSTERVRSVVRVRRVQSCIRVDEKMLITWLFLGRKLVVTCKILVSKNILCYNKSTKWYHPIGTISKIHRDVFQQGSTILVPLQPKKTKKKEHGTVLPLRKNRVLSYLK